MNKLPIAKQVQIINLLVEGNSIRGITRLTGVSKNTVMSLFVRVGKACLRFHSSTVKQLECKRIQCDEQWSFVYAKDKNVKDQRWGVGSVWTWIGMDPDTKLVVSWFVGERTDQSAKYFMNDLWCRLRSRVQLTTDGLSSYREAVADTFGGKVDFAQLVKQYSKNSLDKKGKVIKAERYTGSAKLIVSGNPEMKYITTSHIERLNLTNRMHNRRLARDTNAHSKKYDNHCYSIALQFVHYNFIRPHQKLRVTPAMRAGLIKRFMTIEDLLKFAESNG